MYRPEILLRIANALNSPLQLSPGGVKRDPTAYPTRPAGRSVVSAAIGACGRVIAPYCTQYATPSAALLIREILLSFSSTPSKKATVRPLRDNLISDTHSLPDTWKTRLIGWL